jgi:Flp pilus assembly protein TadD/peroxiredoxin
MGRKPPDKNKRRAGFSRRELLKQMSWAPLLLFPAPLRGAASRLTLQAPRVANREDPKEAPQLSDFRLTPQYPAKSPLEGVIRKVAPGTDEFIAEKHAFEITQLLNEWSSALKSAPPALDALAKLLDASVEGCSLVPAQETAIRQRSGIQVHRRQFEKQTAPGRERFLEEMKTYLAKLPKIETAEFQIVEIEEVSETPQTMQARIRFDMVGAGNGEREQRIGSWLMRWAHREGEEWKIVQWHAEEETLSRGKGPFFTDVTSQVLGQTRSYREQLRYGVDHWRTVLDGACGIDVYGNNGVAVGDFDNDGLDDLYVCQPAGLPNRLYRNRGDGTFEDVTEKSGAGVLDQTACALFADFENKGRQDLLVVCGSGPLLFVNQGDGRFSWKRDAFQFEKPPEGSFTHAALADYDGDGRLDVYFCVYSYYLGLDQYQYPVPYCDARNGPPNFLFHNEGNLVFRDRTAAARLNVENSRYSFACAWGDYDGSGRQSLFVANDFGRCNLYRNNGDGTFSSVSEKAGVDDPGAGMSACWFDSQNSGKLDAYVANMWSAAGIRVSEQKNFRSGDSEEIRAQYRKHARGNSLYRNQGDGRFSNVSEGAGVAMGRWAWCSDSWDLDHDGHPDLYVANGYISAAERLGRGENDLASFFWRQVVGKSPQNDSASPNYERGWNAINELIRSDYSWNGYERNVLYLNNGDGSFSDVSGVAGLDFLEDGRAFALADIDQDGRLEVILKNRNAPQLRILRNTMNELGHAIAFRLQGEQSNRDAIGAAVTVEAGSLRQTKYVQAGSGFLAQHTKELFFGLGQNTEPLRAKVRWPSGLTQSFENLPVGHRIALTEGSTMYQAKPFAASAMVQGEVGRPQKSENPASIGTWLIEPLSAPNFSLEDVSGKTVELASLRGSSVLLHFWAMASPASIESLRALNGQKRFFSANGLRVVALNVDDPADRQKVRSLCAKENFWFPVLFATPEVTGVYNIIYRYLFDRRRDLGVPAAFLIGDDGKIVKLYQGKCDPAQLSVDSQRIPRTTEQRVGAALPFQGVICQARFQRNEFTYGVALFQHGYLEQAAESFKQVIAEDPENAEALYNLGTLYLRSNQSEQARQYLEQTVKRRPNYPEAWNNLGMLCAQEGQADEAIHDFQRSLELRPDYSIALLNLGNLYRRQGNFQESERLLFQALQISPDDPEINYSVGMLYARQAQTERAAEYLQKAVDLRPDYPDALNNLGVLFVQKGRNSDAEETFRTCIGVAPNFDQAYLNLARLYVMLDQKGKARDVLQELLRLQPQHKLARQALEMLN